ncbi:hypothetical protein GCM10010198_71150 [Nocardia seriolae]|nr:hypothetical protein NSERKGN1266_53750 [Nocardia seriolae]GEM25793.1 hypothetical protein NS2_40320 [Nocardia seriolae NBRC 15557]
MDSSTSAIDRADKATSRREAANSASVISSTDSPTTTSFAIATTSANSVFTYPLYPAVSAPIPCNRIAVRVGEFGLRHTETVA